MPSSPLAKKMKFDSAKRAAIINAPEGFLDLLKPSLLPSTLKAMGPESRIWISFQKGSPKMQTDLTRDKGRDSINGVDLKFVNLISVTDTWSAFNLHTYKPGEELQSLPWTERS